MATGSGDEMAEAHEGACRALVVISEAGPSCGHIERPLAGFVAQLIANERRLPAYRRARLAESTEATGRYASLVPAPVSRLDCVV